MMLNERDGGIDGVKIKLVQCETAYNTKQGVECYEKTKNTDPSRAFSDCSAIYRDYLSTHTQSLGGRDPGALHGLWANFCRQRQGVQMDLQFPATYWDQAAVFVKYIAEREGGFDALKGKKIALVYHNSAYGKEPIRTLEKAAEKFGFEFMPLAVDHPGQEQKATWLQIRKEKPDWVMMWGLGCDEPGGHQGGRFDPVPDGSFPRCLVVRFRE